MTPTLMVHQMRAENCFAYLIADLDAREAALVDPRAGHVAEYLAELDEQGLRLCSVIDSIRASSSRPCSVSGFSRGFSVWAEAS